MHAAISVAVNSVVDCSKSQVKAIHIVFSMHACIDILSYTYIANLLT